MTVIGDTIEHGRFSDIAHQLKRGDLLVVNTSATIPAAAHGRRDGNRAVVVHFATPLPDGAWVVELRQPDRSGPQWDGRASERITFRDGADLVLQKPYARHAARRFWRARVRTPYPVQEWLQRHGHPVSYAHTTEPWPLDAYQTVFARDPGSAEMPSAGRPFTETLVMELTARGVVTAPILLHAGLSSGDADDHLLPERYAVSDATARLVNATRAASGRVVAVGTTVVRALETVADPDGTVHADRGWTNLELSVHRPARAVTGLLTGWHEPGSSHLRLLESIAGVHAVASAYEAAVDHRYRWHEFGDSCLFLT
jgi:S-adenosylmethionine:tRNA ribosyltransferase-isomerase